MKEASCACYTFKKGAVIHMGAHRNFSGEGQTMVTVNILARFQKPNYSVVSYKIALHFQCVGTHVDP